MDYAESVLEERVLKVSVLLQSRDISARTRQKGKTTDYTGARGVTCGSLQWNYFTRYSLH